MCGIAGVLNLTYNAAMQQSLPNVQRSLNHRGPDDEGFLAFTQGTVVLGRGYGHVPTDAQLVLLHKRLSILDLGETGHQPLSTPDGRYHMVFNGEIYNYLELRRELEQLGCSFRSTSDTEVLIQGFAMWGPRVLSRLTGMFAFAIFDTARRELFLARDHFGIKPLYYTLQKDMEPSFAFASEVKALLEFTKGKRTVNPGRLYLYLRHGIADQGNETLIKEILQCPPGHYIVVPLDSPTRATVSRYWQLPAACQSDLSFGEAAVQLRELFLESVSLHMRSDVPVGAALSGGIDSSAIVAAMRHLSGQRLELHTFSYIPDSLELSEERWMKMVGTGVGAIMHTVTPTGNDLRAEFDRICYFQDEPFGSTSLYAQNRVFRLASEAGIKVVLDGQGADELLGGYEYCIAARLASLVRQRQWADLARMLQGLANAGPGVISFAARMIDYLVPPTIRNVLRKAVGKDLAPGWLNAAWFEQRGVVPRGPNQSQSTHVLREVLRQALFDTSLPHLLRIEDRNSMAYSVESRVPFLTPKLAEFLAMLPEEYLIGRDGTTKAVFRAAMRGIVPEPILGRRDKIGFATPELAWLKSIETWVEHLLQSELARTIPAFCVDNAIQEWNQVKRGQKPYSTYIWRWVNLLQWVEQNNIVFE